MDTYFIPYNPKKQIIMNRINITMPEGIYYLSDYPQLQQQLPTSSYIFNKVMTGCGATTMFLDDDIPTVLCSPRRELINCKANSSKHIGVVHLFGSGLSGGKKTNADVVLEKIANMKTYINNRLPTPFQTSTSALKILTTYDSCKHVIQGLSEMGILGMFRFVIDEFQTIFTDAAFRGDVEVEFMENIKNTGQQIIFLSATPYLEEYLDRLDEFNQLPYVELIWPDSSKVATNIHRETYYNNSPAATIKRIIEKYKMQGYFEECMGSNNQVYQATEAVFFVNDVNFVCSTISKNRLTQSDTNVICADNDKNSAKLKKVGFAIGHAPREGDAHPTFTFVTKASFEGTDFYSTCAYTYIFSNVNRDNLAIDISLDLPQIMGRQRLSCNPFRYSATFYYMTNMTYSDANKNEYVEKIKCKKQTTDTAINLFNKADAKEKEVLISTYRSAQEIQKYVVNYLSVVDDIYTKQPRVVFNNYVMQNEIRAWQVQQSQYIDGTYVLGAIDNAFNQTTQAAATEIQKLLQSFTGSFETKMETYAKFLYSYPELKNWVQSLTQIPIRFKQYYNQLGPQRLYELSWSEEKSRWRFVKNLQILLIWLEVRSLLDNGILLLK